MGTIPSLKTSSAVSEHPPAWDDTVSSDSETQSSHLDDVKMIKIGAAEDFDGPDDHDDPLIWPVWKKVYHTTMVSLLCLTM